MANSCDGCSQSGQCSAQADGSGCPGAETPEQKLQNNISGIKSKYLVLSGKGGVGKSTVAVNMAMAFANEGKKVGLLDIDIHGPSIPGMMGMKGERLHQDEWGIFPVRWGPISVVSAGFLLKSDKDAIIWRGAMKHSVIQQFLSDVQWGDLDVLIVDSPPGTGDEPLSVAQLLGNVTGAVIVTTPQEVAVADVRRCITFCRQLSIPVTGIVENMSGFVCPHCNETVDIFKTGGGENLALETNTTFLGRIPIDPDFVHLSDEGRPFLHNNKVESPAKHAFESMIKHIPLDKQ